MQTANNNFYNRINNAVGVLPAVEVKRNREGGGEEVPLSRRNEGRFFMVGTELVGDNEAAIFS